MTWAEAFAKVAGEVAFVVTFLGLAYLFTRSDKS